MATILLSINPQHVEKIFNGTKKYEYRRIRCKKQVKRIIIYSTSPVMKVVGEADVEEVLEDSFDKIWEITKEFSGTDYKFLEEYCNGRKTIVAYKLSNVKRYSEPKGLWDYSVKVAPQSFVYLKEI